MVSAVQVLKHIPLVSEIGPRITRNVMLSKLVILMENGYANIQLLHYATYNG